MRLIYFFDLLQKDNSEFKFNSNYQNYKDKFGTIFNTLGDGNAAQAVAIQRGRREQFTEEEAALALAKLREEINLLSPEEHLRRKNAFIQKCKAELEEQDTEAADLTSCILNCLSPDQHAKDIQDTRANGLNWNGTWLRSCWGSCMKGYDAPCHYEREGSEDADTQAISYGSESRVPVPPGAYDFAFPNINNGRGLALESREGIAFMCFHVEGYEGHAWYLLPLA